MKDILALPMSPRCSRDHTVGVCPNFVIHRHAAECQVERQWPQSEHLMLRQFRLFM
jgi:hypothetical protein